MTLKKEGNKEAKIPFKKEEEPESVEESLTKRMKVVKVKMIKYIGN